MHMARLNISMPDLGSGTRVRAGGGVRVARLARMAKRLVHIERPPIASDLQAVGRTVREKIKNLFLNNLGCVVTRDQIVSVVGSEVENWHQRLSELRTDVGYTILSNRDRAYLRPGEYLMENADRRPSAAARVRPLSGTWQQVLSRANDECEWNDDGVHCGLREGELDPIGGGTVRLTPDHMTPHNVNPVADPQDARAWRALCGRHQVMKKNFWDNTNGKLNTYAIVQAAPEQDKEKVFNFLLQYYGFQVKE